jgi:hypothetical protein
MFFTLARMVATPARNCNRRGGRPLIIFSREHTMGVKKNREEK